MKTRYIIGGLLGIAAIGGIIYLINKNNNKGLRVVGNIQQKDIDLFRDIILGLYNGKAIVTIDRDNYVKIEIPENLAFSQAQYEFKKIVDIIQTKGETNIMFVPDVDRSNVLVGSFNQKNKITGEYAQYIDLSDILTIEKLTQKFEPNKGRISAIALLAHELIEGFYGQNIKGDYLVYHNAHTKACEYQAKIDGYEYIENTGTGSIIQGAGVLKFNYRKGVNKGSYEITFVKNNPVNLFEK